MADIKSQRRHNWKLAQVVNSHLVCNPTIRQPGFDLPRQQWSLLSVFARNRDTAVPAEGNGDILTLICVLSARPRWCSTLLNPVPWQNWMAAYLGYALWMKALFRGWPVMVHDTHTRRRRRRRRRTCGTLLKAGYFCRRNIKRPFDIRMTLSNQNWPFRIWLCHQCVPGLKNCCWRSTCIFWCSPDFSICAVVSQALPVKYLHFCTVSNLQLMCFVLWLASFCCCASQDNSKVVLHFTIVNYFSLKFADIFILVFPVCTLFSHLGHRLSECQRECSGL